jgi:putative ABC transport system permease protein
MRLRRFSGIGLRNLRARAQRTLLTAIGIVLGVGIVFGVVALSDTMSSTFTDLYSRAFGAADITVTAAGGSGTFDERVVEEVRGYEGVESAAPRLTLPASLILEGRQENGLPEVQSMSLFGVEPESAALATGFELTEGRFPEGGMEITLDGGSAESAGLEVGDRVTLGTPRGPEKLELVGILRVPGGSLGGFGMAPLPHAREAFDEPGRISGIAVEAAEGTPVTELRERLDRGLGEGLQAERSETRTREITSQLQGFRISLLFFAGTALFVGAFLVFNALSMMILERTRELGMLRALGSTRAMIARSVIAEAIILGLLGSVFGVLFGYGMAKGLVYLFGRAFLFQITELALSPFALVSALVVGVAVTAVAALYPALRAGRVSPVEAMRARSGSSGEGPRSRVLSVLAPLLGLLLLGVGASWIYYLAKNFSADLDGLLYASGIAGVIGAFLGVSLVIPTLVRPLAALFSPSCGSSSASRGGWRRRTRRATGAARRLPPPRSWSASRSSWRSRPWGGACSARSGPTSRALWAATTWCSPRARTPTSPSPQSCPRG